MQISNAIIARFFFRLANLLEIAGESDFRLRAYRKAAETILDWPHSLYEQVTSGGDSSWPPGVGTAIAEKIRGIVETGTFPLYEQISSQIPEALLELLAVRGLGPAKVRTLYHDLNIASVEDLQRALEAGKLRDARGFTPRTEARIQRSLYEFMAHRGRSLRVYAERPVESLLALLETLPGVTEAVAAGDYRRGEETVAEVPVVVATTAPEALRPALADWEFFGHWSPVPEPLLALVTDDELTLTITPVAPAAFGSTLLRLTGPDQHLQQLGPTLAPMPTEKDLYLARSIPWIPPELRHVRAIIQDVTAHGVPHLIVQDACRGDLHMHTLSSDGRHSATDMAQAGRALGYDYVAITDHTRNVRVAGGLHPEEIPEYFAAIDAANRDVPGIRILKGLEVDILADGSMDMPDDILAQLDVVIAAIHSHFDQDLETMTRRVLRAIEHPLVQFVAHPSGRLVGARSPLLLDFDQVFEAAQRTGTMLELNANPERLDLHALHCAEARKRAIPVVINTDAHAVWQLKNLSRGILQARRGGLMADHVLNTRSLPDLLDMLARKRSRP